MAHEYPPIGEHVGTRAASPSGELGTRAESRAGVRPAGPALLTLLADAYAGDREPSEDQLAALGEDLDRGVVSARLSALAEVLRKITPLRVHLLARYLEMACTCGVVTPDDNTDWNAAVVRLPELLEALNELTAE